MAGYDTHRGAKRARELRAELGLADDEPIAGLIALAEQRLGLPVCLVAMREPYEGMCTAASGQTTLWVKPHEFSPRARFTLAHEIGHVRCGHTGQLPLESPATLNASGSGVETQANAFAAELLVPKVAVLDTLGGRTPALEDCVALAARFGVSCHVAAFRFNTLGLGDGAVAEQVKAGEHHETWEALQPVPLTTDLDGAHEVDLPVLSELAPEAGLAAILRGTWTVEQVAAQAGIATATLHAGLQLIGASRAVSGVPAAGEETV